MTTRITDVDKRRRGKYHHGIQTKVLGARVPIDVWQHVKDRADARCESVSDYVCYLIETESMRKR